MNNILEINKKKSLYNYQKMVLKWVYYLSGYNHKTGSAKAVVFNGYERGIGTSTTAAMVRDVLAEMLDYDVLLIKQQHIPQYEKTSSDCTINSVEEVQKLQGKNADIIICDECSFDVIDALTEIFPQSHFMIFNNKEFITSLDANPVAIDVNLQFAPALMSKLLEEYKPPKIFLSGFTTLVNLNLDDILGDV